MTTSGVTRTKCERGNRSGWNLILRQRHRPILMMSIDGHGIEIAHLTATESDMNCRTFAITFYMMAFTAWPLFSAPPKLAAMRLPQGHASPSRSRCGKVIGQNMFLQSILIRKGRVVRKRRYHMPGGQSSLKCPWERMGSALSSPLRFGPGTSFAFSSTPMRRSLYGSLY